MYGLVGKALLIGAVIEALLAWMMIGSSWGPCGPGTVLGYVGMFAHFFPGFIVGSAVEQMGASDPVATAFMFGAQFVFWAALALLVLAVFKNRRHGA